MSCRSELEESNLERQLLFTEKDINQYKVNVAINRLKKINSNIEINACNVRISDIETINKVIKDVDIVLSTIDKPSRIIRDKVNIACLKNNIPVLFCGFSEYLGLVGPFVIPHKTPCLQCSELEINISDDNEFLNPERMIASFGPLCGIISSIVAFEIMKYLSNFELPTLPGSTLMINIMNYTIKQHKWTVQEKCPACGGE